jgi:hypothetical protein
VERPPVFRSRYGNQLASAGNVLYVILFGWWLALAYCLLGCVLWISLIGQDYTQMCWDMAAYMLWPFGKYLCRHRQKSGRRRIDSDRSGGGSNLALFDERSTLLSVAVTRDTPTTGGNGAVASVHGSSASSSRAGTPEPVNDGGSGLTIKEALKRPGFYVWAPLCIVLWILHGIVCCAHYRHTCSLQGTEGVGVQTTCTVCVCVCVCVANIRSDLSFTNTPSTRLCFCAGFSWCLFRWRRSSG